MLLLQPKILCPSQHWTTYTELSPAKFDSCVLPLHFVVVYFYGEMSNDAIFLTNFLEKIIFVFATIVCAKTLDLSATLSFYHRLPFEKNFQYFIFYFHRIHPQSSRKVINKGYKIVFPNLMKVFWKHPKHLNEHNPKYL